MAMCFHDGCLSEQGIKSVLSRGLSSGPREIHSCGRVFQIAGLMAQAGKNLTTERCVLSGQRKPKSLRHITLAKYVLPSVIGHPSSEL
jgi:hypothetical protein